MSILTYCSPVQLAAPQCTTRLSLRRWTCQRSLLSSAGSQGKSITHLYVLSMQDCLWPFPMRQLHLKFSLASGPWISSSVSKVLGSYRVFLLIIQDYLSSLAPIAKSLWQRVHIFTGETLGQSSKDSKSSLPQWVSDTNFV